MATVNAGKYGIGLGGASGTFTTARTSNAQSVNNQSTSANVSSLRASRASGRSGSIYTMYRFFCAFDVSAYASGYTITSLSLKFRTETVLPTIGFNGIVLESSAQGNADTDLVVGDFYSSVDYTTAYSSSSAINTLAGNKDQSWTLNSTAIAAFSSSYVKLVIVQNANDYSNTAGTSDYTDSATFNFSAGSSGYVPYLEFTATPTGWIDGDINGTTSPEEKLNGLAYTDIAFIDLIPFTP